MVKFAEFSALCWDTKQPKNSLGKGIEKVSGNFKTEFEAWFILSQANDHCNDYNENPTKIAPLHAT